MDNFNFRDLGSRNSRRLAATRLKHYTRFLSLVFGPKAPEKCNKVLQGCINFSNEKIKRDQLIIIQKNFREEFFSKNNIPKPNNKNITILDITKAYLLLRAIEECSNLSFYPRITFNLINGYVAMSGWYMSEAERLAQTRAYNRYMQKRRREITQVIAKQQPNVLYPNRQISLGEQE